jgi:hypothetical protein
MSFQLTSIQNTKQDIIRDISLIQSPVSNNASRLEAQKRLDSLKTDQRVAEMKIVGLEIFKSLEYDLYVRYFNHSW